MGTDFGQQLRQQGRLYIGSEDYGSSNTTVRWIIGDILLNLLKINIYLMHLPTI